MVKAEMGRIQLKGPDSIIFAEVTTILREYFKLLVENFGEEEATEILVDIGRLAVMDDDEVKHGLREEC